MALKEEEILWRGKNSLVVFKKHRVELKFLESNFHIEEWEEIVDKEKVGPDCKRPKCWKVWTF